jgi:hypothetical protein
MRASLLLHQKSLAVNRKTGQPAIVEMKIWRIPESKNYPQGRKYSLFLVVGGQVIVGFDNHKPKGPHIHLGDQELPYLYRGDESLIDDFLDLIKKAGFEI